VTSDTDVFRKTSDGRFVRLGSAGDFLPKGFVAPVIVQQQGWWQLELKTLAFVPGGAGWVAADHLELVP